MRKFPLISLVLLTLSFGFTACHKEKVKCKKIIELQPGANFGKDAYIHQSFPDKNAGHAKENLAIHWTFDAIGGDPGACRSLIQFDLTAVPQDAKITSATLSLYHSDGTQNSHGGHSTINGSNEAYIYEVTEPWKEYEVTWNNQPSINTGLKVYIPESTSQKQDYEKIDLLELVEHWHADAENNHGMLIKLITEQYYRALNFASSDHSNSDIHPKLTIAYEQ